MTALWNLLFFIVAIGILVTVHEAGHFLMARRMGVFCERFSIGFGKVLWRFHDKKGTEYAISAIPLGGYVKMKGEGADGSAEPDSYAAKSVGKRALIIAAGPLCNIVLAFLLYIVVALNGSIDLRPVTADVRPGSLAAEAGLSSYDEILQVNGTAADSWSDVVMELIENLGSQVSVEVKGFSPEIQKITDYEGVLKYEDLIPYAHNESAGVSRTLRLNLENITLGAKADILDILGIRPLMGVTSNIITMVQEGSPAYQAGLQAGDAILAVNGQETKTWVRLQDEVFSSTGRLELIVLRDGKEYKTYVVPERHCDEQGVCRNLIGVGTEYYPISNLTFERSYSFTEALGKAAENTVQMSMLILRSTMMLVDGTISAENISGPISIARGAGQSASIGLIFFISFLAAVSVNLGILNLLPVPVLDGGQLLFLAYEAVVGKQPSAAVQTVLTALGLGFLVTLSLFAIFNDIRAL